MLFWSKATSPLCNENRVNGIKYLGGIESVLGLIGFESFREPYAFLNSHSKVVFPGYVM